LSSPSILTVSANARSSRGASWPDRPHDLKAVVVMTRRAFRCADDTAKMLQDFCEAKTPARSISREVPVWSTNWPEDRQTGKIDRQGADAGFNFFPFQYPLASSRP